MVSGLCGVGGLLYVGCYVLPNTYQSGLRLRLDGSSRRGGAGADSPHAALAECTY